MVNFTKGSVMTYIEQNVHTGERRQHTDVSLGLRLRALNTPKMPETGIPNLPIDTQHSWFRLPRTSGIDEKPCIDEQYPALPACETGAWGQSCPVA
jgi:hypothetical protein